MRTTMTRWGAALALVAGTMFAGCEEDGGRPASTDPRIVGGGEYDFEGGVGILGCDAGGFCTASLVGSQTVLTAAHCIQSPGWNALDCGPLQFYATHPFEDVPRPHAVANVMVHPQWDASSSSGSGYDVAVLRLAEPIAVPTSALSDTPPQDGAVLSIVGYGQTAYDDPASAGVKRIGRMIVDHVGDLMIEFTSEDGVTTCNGDSGGPYFSRIDGYRRQVGVHSAGAYCAGGGEGVRVDRHLEWIAEQADGDLGCGGVDYDGHCNGTTMVWCADQRLHYYDCGRQETANACARDDDGRAKCVPSPYDPDAPPAGPGDPEPDPIPSSSSSGSEVPAAGCGDIDFAGVCDGDVLRWCEGGELEVYDCGDAGMTCGWQDDTVGNNCL